MEVQIAMFEPKIQATPEASSSANLISSSEAIRSTNIQQQIGNKTQEETNAMIYTATPKLATDLYNLMPKTMQFVLYDFWEMFHNPEFNKYTLLNGGPWIVCSLIGLYLYFVLKFGPKWMENRQPYSLKPLMRVYNFSMVVLNAYLFYETSILLNFGRNSWGCDRAIQPLGDESIPIIWLVLVSRFFDFFDTVFFILRKKFSHVSFLHVFHHAVVPIGFWVGIKFAWYHVCCFVPYLNLIVHVIMYTYYGLSTFGPWMHRYLWWKKHLTSIQISQFLIALVHSLQPLYLQKCTFPAIFVMGQTLGALLFLWLFISFYINAYVMKNRNSTTTTSMVKSPSKDLDTREQLEADKKSR